MSRSPSTASTTSCVRELLAQAHPAAPPAHLHPRRRVDRDLGLLPGPRLQLLVPVLRRLHARQGPPRRVLGEGGGPGQGRLALPGRLRPDHLRGRHRRRGRTALRRAHPVLLQPVPSRVPRLRRPPRVPHHQDPQAGALSQLPSAAQKAILRADLGGPGRGWPCDRREPGDGAGPHGGHDHRLRIGTVFCLLHTGNQPDWKTRYSTELFATRSCPSLRDMWPDYAGDDRWWIHPLETRVDPTSAPLRPASARRPVTAAADDGPHRQGGHAGWSRTARRAARPWSTSTAPAARWPTSASWPGWPTDRPRVFAPELPGYGESTGEELLEDMLDFTLHGWDVVDALGIDRPGARRPLDGGHDRGRDGGDLPDRGRRRSS